MGLACGTSKLMAKDHYGGGPAGAVYGLGFIGALIYFVTHTAGFWMIVLGVLKAIVWPAILVYELFRFIGR